MNLVVLRRSRPLLKAGDIFVMRPPMDGYLFGRVIDVDANLFGFGKGILLYIYKTRSALKVPVPVLLRDEMLVPPVITNRLAWTRGYFENVEYRPLTSSDRLPQHCFKNSFGKYFDEKGNTLQRPVEPVGAWALASFRTIDIRLSNALGIPQSQENAALLAAQRMPGRRGK